MTTPTLPEDKAIQINISLDPAATLQHLIDTHGREQVQALLDGNSVIVPRAITEDMFVSFAETWFAKSRCIDDCEMEDCYDAMLAARPGAKDE